MVWVTGASSGIGRSLAVALAASGARLILSARDRTALEEVQRDCADFGAVRVLPLDLARLEALPAAAAEAEATRLFFVTLVSFVVVIWIGLFIWVFFIAPVIPTTGVIAPPAGADLLVVLAPVVATAAGVERLLESVFNTLENVWRTGVAYLGYGMRWLKRAETEVADARTWLQNIGMVYTNLETKYADEMNELMQQVNMDQIATQLENLRRRANQETAKVQEMLAEAENRATETEKKLAQASSSPDYRSAKAAASVVLGLMLGVIVATVGQIKMLALGR